MSKLNSNEVLYWCHRETPFLLARIHREVRFAVQQPSWSRSGFSVFAWAGSEVYKVKDSRSNTRPPILVSAWESGIKKRLMTVSWCCFCFCSSRPGRPPKRLQSVTEGGTHHMLSHSGLMHAGIMPPAGDHPLIYCTYTAHTVSEHAGSKAWR